MSQSDSRWVGPVQSHGVWIDVDGPSVVIHAARDAYAYRNVNAAVLVFDEAMDVADVLTRAIRAAVANALPEQE